MLLQGHQHWDLLPEGAWAYLLHALSAWSLVSSSERWWETAVLCPWHPSHPPLPLEISEEVQTNPFLVSHFGVQRQHPGLSRAVSCNQPASCPASRAPTRNCVFLAPLLPQGLLLPPGLQYIVNPSAPAKPGCALDLPGKHLRSCSQAAVNISYFAQVCTSLSIRFCSYCLCDDVTYDGDFMFLF